MEIGTLVPPPPPVPPQKELSHRLRICKYIYIGVTLPLIILFAGIILLLYVESLSQPVAKGELIVGLLAACIYYAMWRFGLVAFDQSRSRFIRVISGIWAAIAVIIVIGHVIYLITGWDFWSLVVRYY